MIQKQSNNRSSGRAHNHQEWKGHSRSVVQQRACSVFFFNAKETVHREFVPPNTTSQLWILRWGFQMPELKCVMKKTRTLENPQLAPSWQCAWPHVPEKHRLCDWQQKHGYRSPFSIFTRLSPPVISLCFPNWKLNWKEVLKQCLTSKGNCKRYSTALRKMTSTMLWKHKKKKWDHYTRSQGDYFGGDGHQNWVS
jgi:hypothetical protein